MQEQGEPLLATGEQQSSSETEEEIYEVPLGKRRRANREPEETDSDSDFENIETIERKSKAPGKSFLEEYLSFGELAGRIPESLIVNVDFGKFSKENGFETLGEGVNCLKSDTGKKLENTNTAEVGATKEVAQ